MATNLKSGHKIWNLDKWRKHALLLGATATIWPSQAFALGLRIPNQDASAIARGNAFAATADNPSAVYYNPAGITQLEGHNVQVGSLFYLGIYGDYESPAGVRTENNPEVMPVPNLYYAFSPKDSPLSFGLGVYEPFGFSVNWPETAPFRSSGIEGKLTYITLNPLIAWQVHRTLSLAAGPTFNYSRIELRRGILANPNIVPGDRFEFDGDNLGYGFTAGLLWQPHEKWSFGASYRSGSRMDYRGDAMLFPPLSPLPGSASTSCGLDFPQIVIGGISYRPNRDWNIEFNVDWADWKSVDKLSIPPYPPTTLDWKSSFMYEFGVTRYFPKGFYLSAGYFFSEASTSDAYFTPLVPDIDLHIGSLGGGYKGKCWSWALAVQIIAGNWRTGQNAEDPSVTGRYRLFTPTLSFSAGYHF